MSRYLDRARELRAIVTPHYNCAQSVLLPFAADAGMDEAQALRAAANFGGGMRIGETCGAFTGGLMALGMHGVDDPAVVQRFARELMDRHTGTLCCAELLRRNAERGGEKKPHCDALVFDAVETVERILRETGKLG